MLENKLYISEIDGDDFYKNNELPHFHSKMSSGRISLKIFQKVLCDAIYLCYICVGKTL